MGHPLFARLYARRSVAQARQQAPHRREMLAGLSGRVLEVGCGNGLNFVHYPPEVTEVVAVEPEPYLRRAAAVTAAALPRITVVEGTAEALPITDGEPFDAGVFSLVLCSVSDPTTVLRQAIRTMRAGAEMRFYEHILSDDPPSARVQHLFAPLWRLAAGGCRPDRDTISAIGRELDVVSIRKFDFCAGPRIPLTLVAPHAIVVAQVREAS
jgi:SAM-dependent methyltransferase